MRLFALLAFQTSAVLKVPTANQVRHGKPKKLRRHRDRQCLTRNAFNPLQSFGEDTVSKNHPPLLGPYFVTNYSIADAFDQ